MADSQSSAAQPAYAGKRAKPVRRTPAEIQARAKKWRMVGSMLLGVLIWELVGRYVVTDKILFVPFSDIIVKLWEYLENGALWRHVWVSSAEFGLGFALSSAIGIAIGVAMAVNRFIRDVLDPWVSALYSSPLVALTPFFILVFGVGLASKVAIVFTVAIFPILLNTFVGIRSTDRNLLDVAAAFNCSGWQTFRKVMLPAALPFIITGMRLGVGRGLTGVVVGELFASREGLGYLIATGGQSFDTALVFMGVLLFSLAGVALMELLNRVEMRLSPWRQSLESKES